MPIHRCGTKTISLATSCSLVMELALLILSLMSANSTTSCRASRPLFRDPAVIHSTRLTPRSASSLHLVPRQCQAQLRRPVRLQYRLLPRQTKARKQERPLLQRRGLFVCVKSPLHPCLEQLESEVELAITYLITLSTRKDAGSGVHQNDGNLVR